MGITIFIVIFILLFFLAGLLVFYFIVEDSIINAMGVVGLIFLMGLMIHNRINIIQRIENKIFSHPQEQVD
jgi:multidrug efflux pump subunit AcrB|tara:strand:+ start:198 stop:410 length:213 start_codon:yes stop_codon:yes gene_type:complete